MNRFEINFKTIEDEQILSTVDSKNKFILRDGFGNGTWGLEEEINMYPFSVFKEYIIVFEVLNEHWKVV